MDRPINLPAPMVRAILEGRKTQTRQIIKPQPFRVGGPFYRPSPKTTPYHWHSVSASGLIANIQHLRWAAGDRLWVREAWRTEAQYNASPPRDIPPGSEIHYEASTGPIPWAGNLRPPIFMPRWASRITLLVEQVRVQRLQEISGADAIGEGVECQTCKAIKKSACHRLGCFASIEAFKGLWSSINGPGSWDANQFVAALTFRQILANIDQEARDADR